MSGEAQSVLLLLVGGAILRVSLTDAYLRYVKDGLRPFLVVAGVLLVVIAVATLARELSDRRQPAPADGSGHGDGSEHGDGSGHGGPRVAWLLLLPVFALVLVGPPALGSYSAGKAGTAVTRQSDYAPLPTGDPRTPLALPVLDYASRAVFDRGASLGDRRVALTGFLSPRPGGGYYLTRMVLVCCAADARPIKVGLRGDLPGSLAEGDWVEVVGRYDRAVDTDRVNAESIPFLAADDVRAVDAPREQYE